MGACLWKKKWSAKTPPVLWEFPGLNQSLGVWMGSFSPKTWNWPSSSWVRVNPRLSLIYTALSPNFPGKCGNPIINLQLWFNGSISPIAFLVKTCVKLRAGWGLLVSAMSHFFKKKNMTSWHPNIPKLSGSVRWLHWGTMKELIPEIGWWILTLSFPPTKKDPDR